MKTFVTTPKIIKRQWHLIDAQKQVLGRLGTRLAVLLQGKNKPYYSAHLDCGDYIVVINADKVVVTGKKSLNKKYYRHSNFPGGFKTATFDEQLTKDSRKIITRAVKNMLPKNKLRSPRLKRLKVFKTEIHNYQDKFVTPKAL